jgi:hypothetical protein
MPTYVMLTGMSIEALHQRQSFETLERHAVDGARRSEFDPCQDLGSTGAYD